MPRAKNSLSLVVLCGVVAALVVTAAVPSQAQMLEVTKRVDITAFAGWRWGGSVDYTETNSNERRSASLDANASYGGIVDLNIHETWEGHVLLEFYFSQQNTDVQVRPPNQAKMPVTKMDVRYYHGGIGYEWKLPSQVSPYILFTMGGTQFSVDDFTNEAGQTRPSSSTTKFSWGFAGGIKYRLTPRFGLRGDLRSFGTSTDIRDTGWACGYYDCALVSFKQTVWQGDVTGGVYVAF